MVIGRACASAVSANTPSTARLRRSTGRRHSGGAHAAPISRATRAVLRAREGAATAGPEARIVGPPLVDARARELSANRHRHVAWAWEVWDRQDRDGHRHEMSLPTAAAAASASDSGFAFPPRRATARAAPRRASARACSVSRLGRRRGSAAGRRTREKDHGLRGMRGGLGVHVLRMMTR